MEGGKHDSCINFDCVNILSVRIAERCAKLFGQRSALSGDCLGKYLRRGTKWSGVSNTLCIPRRRALIFRGIR